MTGERLRTIWLDTVIGWNEGVEIRARAKVRRARDRALRAKGAWNEINPHPWNRKHEHRWADLTRVADHHERLMCTICGEKRTGDRR